MAASSIELAQRALRNIGAAKIQSFDDANEQAQAVRDNYEQLALDRLTEHAWSFATKRQLLNRIGEAGDGAPFAWEYHLPADSINLRRLEVVSDAGRPVGYKSYELENSRIYAQREQGLYAVYNWRAPESSWPPDFAGAFVKLLEAELIRALIEDEVAAMKRENIAETKFTRARARDRIRRPAHRSGPGRLATAWRHG